MLGSRAQREMISSLGLRMRQKLIWKWWRAKFKLAREQVSAGLSCAEHGLTKAS